jgi:uncharacterized membrane protein
MQTQRSLYPRMAAALLALLGLLDAAYLALERMLGDTAGIVCPTGGGCVTVQSSAYSTLFGIPVAYIGVAGYTVLLGVALLSLSMERVAGLRVPTLLVALSGIGLLFALYLSYLQVVVIRAICFWCVVSALLELGIWVAALLDWRLLRAGSPAALS